MNTEDAKQLDLLSTLHYVVGTILGLFSCIPLLHLFMGLAIVMGKIPQDANCNQPPAFFGWIFVIMGAVFIIFGWTTAICILIAAKKLKARKNFMFCQVVAAVACMFMPLGTILGIFTLIHLNKDSVKQSFQTLDSNKIE